ncbi:hypothetical protein T4D_2950 [Trichinella pseudospiralis]|uniref:Uncharacterized protein n=1 Tax=Trichinella pseudospiralis TaxID=6337 RepID=A0A0V1F2V5_TRIPS|nr:hypothetical protein T4D_2950 [Trichinella pseudospiralis]
MIQDISSDQIGKTETSGSLSRLVDYINSYFVLLQNMIVAMRAHLSSYIEELVRAREELNSHALVRNLLALLNPCLGKARQLVKYEDSLSTGKQADDFTDWHI